MKIEIIRAKVAQLDREGITPLDLFSWTYLLDFRARYKDFQGIDLDIHHDMQEAINNALWKKARMMDAHEKTRDNWLPHFRHRHESVIISQNPSSVT